MEVWMLILKTGREENLTQMYVESIFPLLLLQCRVLFNYKEIIYITVYYSWPLNNIDLNCAGPLICGLLSVNTVLLRSVVGWIQRCRGPTLGLEQQPSILVSTTDGGTNSTRISRDGLECSEYKVGEVKIDNVF